MSKKKDEKVLTAMEEVKALIYAVSNYNADEVKAAARVRTKRETHTHTGGQGTLCPSFFFPRVPSKQRHPPKQKSHTRALPVLPHSSPLSLPPSLSPHQQLFSKKTGGKVGGLGDGNGRTPLHLVRITRIIAEGKG